MTVFVPTIKATHTLIPFKQTSGLGHLFVTVKRPPSKAIKLILGQSRFYHSFTKMPDNELPCFLKKIIHFLLPLSMPLRGKRGV